jgi:crotonobetaine/carnitine-CoA ligase
VTSPWAAPVSSTLQDALRAQCDSRPDEACYVINDKVTTFADLEHRVRTVASRLVGLGVGTGDCVALFTQTCR